MKLKGLLKGLCILGLTLLPISFSNADDCATIYTGTLNPGIIYNTSMGNYSRVYHITNNLNFMTDLVYDIFYFTIPANTCGGTGPRSWGLFWNNGKIYGYGNQQAANKIIKQGYYNSYCLSTISAFESYCVPDNTNTYGGNYTTPIDYFYRLGAIYDQYYFNNYVGSKTPELCFISTSSDMVACFMMNITNNTVYGDLNSFITEDNILQGVFDSPGSFDTTKFQLSPFNSSNWRPATGSSYWSPKDNAQNIYDSYVKQGYSDKLCYGGFAIDNIISTGNSSFTDIQVGRGASIFDLYNYYSGGFSSDTHLSFVDWYNDWDFEYGFFYDNQQAEISNYIGKPKGFVGAFMIKDFYFRGDDFSASMLENFCNFTIANAPLIDKTQTPIDTINDTVNENALNKLIGDIGIVIPGSGSAIDIVVGTLSGYYQQDFSSAWASGFDMFSSIRTVSDRVGILPSYICIGLLLFVLLYLFKK